VSPAVGAPARSPALGRGIAAGVAALLAAVAAGAFAAPAPAARPTVPPSQSLVVLLRDHVVRAAPAASAPRIESVSGRRPLTRVRTVLPVIGSRRGRTWLQVRLPGRPNGHHGWITSAHTRPASTEWHIVVRLGARRVIVYRGGRVERSFRAVIGTPGTPTPRGRFFVEEALALSARQAGGPFALATSARSQVLEQFAGGPGQIALHGTANLPGALGNAASHGCVRLSTRAITWLARRIGAGVPLRVTL